MIVHFVCMKMWVWDFNMYIFVKKCVHDNYINFVVVNTYIVCKFLNLYFILWTHFDELQRVVKIVLHFLGHILQKKEDINFMMLTLFRKSLGVSNNWWKW